MLTTLHTWSPTYIGEAIRQTASLGLNPALQNFEDWVNEPGIVAVNPSMAPRFVVHVPGTVGTPERHGDGTYRATWIVEISLWLWGTDYQTTEDYLGYYVTALREAVLQHPSLGGFAETSKWVSEKYKQIASPTAYHTWAQSILTIHCTVDGALNAYTGPVAVPADPSVAPVPRPPWTTSTINVNGL